MDSREEFKQLIEGGAVSSFIGLAIGMMRAVVQEKYKGWLGFFRCVCASLMVAVLVGWGLQGTTFSAPTRSMIVGLTALVADDVLVSVLTIAKLMGKDPFDFLLRIISAYRGQVQPPKPKDD